MFGTNLIHTASSSEKYTCVYMYVYACTHTYIQNPLMWAVLHSKAQIFAESLRMTLVVTISYESIIHVKRFFQLEFKLVCISLLFLSIVGMVAVIE
jgi:hypothetical protein